MAGEAPGCIDQVAGNPPWTGKDVGPVTGLVAMQGCAAAQYLSTRLSPRTGWCCGWGRASRTQAGSERGASWPEEGTARRHSKTPSESSGIKAEPEKEVEEERARSEAGRWERQRQHQSKVMAKKYPEEPLLCTLGQPRMLVEACVSLM